MIVRRRALLLGWFVVACGGGQQQSSTTPTPQSMSAAIDRFMAAVKANDLDQMGRLWGNEKGSMSDQTHDKDREQLRQRLVVMQKMLTNKSYRIVEGPLPSSARGEVRMFRVELERGACKKVVPMDVVKTHAGGWLLLDPHLEQVGSPNAPCPAAGTDH